MDPSKLGNELSEPPPQGQDPGDRGKRLAAVIVQVVQQRSSGSSLSDADVIAANPGLMPELQAELAALRDVHRAFLAAQKAGPLQVPDEPSVKKDGPAILHPLTASYIVGYTISQEISSGGQGAVFKATQESTGRTVAIKILPGGPLISSRHRERFEREVGILAALDHPNVVSILDRGRAADGSLFMVMDFIDGCPLDEYLDRDHRKPPRDVDAIVNLFITIAQAVHEAHLRGVVHRDLKPSNIRIDNRGQPHVLDFGLARLTMPTQTVQARPVTLTGQIVGSLPWASPEQVSGDPENVDVRSDVYSLGIMLYQALAGRFPYSVTGNIPEVIQNIISATPLPPSRSFGKPRLSPGLDEIVLRALSKSPDQRQASAGEFAEELQQYVSGTYRLAGRPRRTVGWRTLAALAVLLAIAGVVCYQMDWLPFGPRRPEPSVANLRSLVNSIDIKLVQIPAGDFWMGSPTNQQGRNTDEWQHHVWITHEFWLGVTPVTQEQYQAVMGALPANQGSIGSNLPVQGVRWAEADEFCKRLNAKAKETGRKYRLPTEAEWEYACCAGTTLQRGTTLPLADVAWYRGHSNGHQHLVGSKKPNYWGLHDMLGSVQEWCRDAYEEAYPGNRPTDPQGPEGLFRVLRGGSIDSPPESCRAAARTSANAKFSLPDVGFRVAMEETGPGFTTAPTTQR